MNATQMVRGPMLNPRSDGTVQFVADGAVVGDANGRIVASGAWQEIGPRYDPALVRRADGWIVPPMLDAHIHIPQHPIRGRFLEGVVGMPPEGPLLAGLNRNVFPAEGRCGDPEEAERVVACFRDDTLSHGVIGGAAYMTVHAAATRAALARLHEAWSVGLVLMQRNCPEYLRTDEANLERDVERLARDFGHRLIVTDRFAGAVDTPLRRRGVALAERLGLRMQTHLCEQIAEVQWIESLYPEAHGYTDVYRRDGLLARSAILAHCIRMRPEEFDMVAATPGAVIAHCPVSNTLLGSGVMPLDEVVRRNIPYALCTDVGASPTVSLLCEMVQFLRVHAGRSKSATPQEALFRATLAPAQILGLGDRLGSFDVGKEMSFLEIAAPAPSDSDADRAILSGLLELSDADSVRCEPGQPLGRLIDRLQATGLGVGDDLAELTAEVERTAHRLDAKVRRVTLAGTTAWERT